MPDSTPPPAAAKAPSRRAGLTVRAAVLFVNFFFIILAYYQVKAASRTLLLEHGGPQAFPYVWIYSALVLLAIIGTYHRIVERFSRIRVISGSLVAFSALLVTFRVAFGDAGTVTAVLFYIFVDIFSVVLVEQFWSLTNSVNRLDEGRRSYWFVGSGGLVGGIAGGLIAGALVSHTPMTTEDLLLSCAGLLLVTMGLNVWMWRTGLFEEVTQQPRIPLKAGDWRGMVRSPYLVLIALVLCMSQLAQPVIEFQFISTVNDAIADTDERTVFISRFFSVMGLVSIGVNLVLTPLIHSRLGVFAGMAVQPLLIAGATAVYMAVPTLMTASAMKIADRGLSYSINRASKELLYIPLDPVLTYQAKAWIDMLGYRLFKVLGSGLILLVTGVLPSGAATALGWLTLLICVAWGLAIARLASEYRLVAQAA